MLVGLSFQIMNNINAIVKLSDDTGISPEIVFADLSINRYFADKNMAIAVSQAYLLAFFGNEESINNGDYLTWTYNAGGHNDGGYMLSVQSNYYVYAWLSRSEDSEQRRHQEEQSAIAHQLGLFRSAQEYLQNLEGLVYYLVTKGGDILSNAGTDIGLGWFRSQPVYYIRDGVSAPEAPFSYDYEFNHYSPFYNWESNENTRIFIAYTTEAVNASNIIYREAQRSFMFEIINLAVSSALLLGLLVVLLLGAGRKRSGVGVHFALIDKPFLDISLVVTASWVVLAVWFAYELSWIIWRQQNTGAMVLLFAAVSVTVVSPVLLWLMSFAKRVKAGYFWRHTLVYFIPSRFLRFLKSLWAGFPLTVKVVLISLISLGMLIITALFGVVRSEEMVLLSVVVFTASVTYFLLRYARRIHHLEAGARKAADGSYGFTINVGKGELGSIADSINSIMGGINIAVEQRMKSERLKTELITNVSHDIRTPLTSIITYTDLLKHEGLDCEKAGEYLEVLIQKSQRLKTLTDELFEAAKAATGNIDVTLAEMDVVSLINQVLGELDESIKSSGLDLRTSMPDKLLALADGRLMWRVMENLLSNVFKYALPGSRVYLDARLDDNYVLIEMKNVSAAELNFDPAELTERFKRGDDSRTDGGSGLGLSIAQSFVAAQGGEFKISIDGDLFKVTMRLNT